MRRDGLSTAALAGTPLGPAPESAAGAGRRVPPWAGGALGLLALVILWWLLAATVLAGGRALPTPWDLMRQMAGDVGFYPHQIEATAATAAKGYLIGNGLAVGLAVAFFGVPLAERVLLQVGVASYCLPVIAVGPILTTVFHGRTPQVALAGLSVFFTTLVATLLGLRAADTASLDVVRAAGGGRVQQMRFVRLRAALPRMFAALRVAAPAAVLGAVIGEFLGADSGLGVAMVTSQQSLEVARTWGLAIVASAVAGAGYALAALASRLATPWATRVTAATPEVRRRDRRGTRHRPRNGPAGAVRGSSTAAPVRAGSRALLSIAAPAAVVVGLWCAFIEVFDLDPLIAKDPQAVYDYLFTASDATENRGAVFGGLWHTIGDAAAGYVAGTAAATVAAIAFVRYRPVGQALMPVAMMLRSVPLVAMTPLLTLVFGRGLPAVMVITGIVVFFPSLVNLVSEMRAAPAAAVDLVLACGGGPFTVLRKVAIPSALPAFFASARIAVPGAVVGALLAEWLATGEGLGYLMQHAQQTFDYGGVWAAVVTITATSITIYAVVGCVETLVLARHGRTAKHE